MLKSDWTKANIMPMLKSDSWCGEGDQGKHYRNHVEIRLDQGKHYANVEIWLVVGWPRQTLQESCWNQTGPRQTLCQCWNLTRRWVTKENITGIMLKSDWTKANIMPMLKSDSWCGEGDQGKHYRNHVEIRLDQGKHYANVEIWLVVWGGWPRQTLQESCWNRLDQGKYYANVEIWLVVWGGWPRKTLQESCWNQTGPRQTCQCWNLTRGVGRVTKANITGIMLKSDWTKANIMPMLKSDSWLGDQGKHYRNHIEIRLDQGKHYANVEIWLVVGWPRKTLQESCWNQTGPRQTLCKCWNLTRGWVTKENITGIMLKSDWTKANIMPMLKSDSWLGDQGKHYRNHVGIRLDQGKHYANVEIWLVVGWPRKTLQESCWNQTGPRQTLCQCWNLTRGWVTKENITGIMLESDWTKANIIPMLKSESWCGKHYSNVEIRLGTKANIMIGNVLGGGGDQGKHYSNHVEIRLDQGKHYANVEIWVVVWETLQQCWN